MQNHDSNEVEHACGEVSNHHLLKAVNSNSLKLKKGADCARGDDTNNLKQSIAIWLNNQTPHPSPLLTVNDKQKRGFNHDLTGGLLCPVDYDWTDPVYVNVFSSLFLPHPN